MVKYMQSRSEILFLFAILIGIATFSSSSTFAQPPGPPQGRPAEGRRDGPPQRRGGFRGPPGFLLMTALDADDDGKLSAEEISNAAAALKKLDKDGDGKLSGKEIGWPPDFVRGFGGQRGGQRGRPGTDRDSPQGRGGPAADRGRPGRSPQPSRPDRPGFEEE